jgi:NAD(P)-dependent dehydrogenase (short-subunit alcohol dehydrogenase family)
VPKDVRSLADKLFDLSGKRVLVTGAGGAHGLVYSRAFSEMGAYVISVDIDADAAQATVDAVVRDGGRAQAEKADITSPGDVANLAGRLGEADRPIDVLVNNAGIVTPGAMTHELTDDQWSRVLGVNLTGAFNMIRAFVPSMRKAGGGSIINIASIVGIVGVYPGFPMVNSNYAAAKAGLIGLSRQVAAEYAAEGIRSNVLAPGWLKGSGLKTAAKMSSEKAARFEEVVAAGTPMGRRGDIEDLCGAVLWLASDSSAYVTGQVIAQDGGWTAV